MLDRLLARLQESKGRYAIEALEKPVSKDGFEYGTHHGVLKGLDLVEQLIREMLEEEEDDERR